MFLEIPGIEGEASAPPGEARPIEVSAVEWNFENEGDKNCPLPLHVSKYLDSSSTALMRASLDGAEFPEVVLTAAKSLSDTGPGSTVSYVYFTAIMNDVGVLSASSSVNAGVERQTEDVVFCIGKLTAEYTPYDKDGKSGAPTDLSRDITKNRKN